jgi:filamentous hemagglutinin family protein
MRQRIANIFGRVLRMTLFAAPVLFALTDSGWCGVSTDGTLGAATVLAGPNYAITPNLGRQTGGNLFHSVSQFSLSSGEKAIFSGPAGISAIITRVTGGASSINGTISSTIPGADLYLVNPAGITFGPNATLDVSGSFHASTADHVVLGTSGRFPSDPAATLNLTVDPPTAFGFLKPPHPITMDGSFLAVQQGKTLSLTAGDITISNANLWSYGGTVALVSLASAGEVNSGTYAATASSMGTIRVSDTRAVFAGPVYKSAGMKGLKIANIDASGNGGGKVFIRGGAFYMSSAFIFNDTYGNVPGAITDITMTGRIELISTSITGAGMRAGSASGAATSLTAGDILIRGDNSRGAYVNSDSWNGANGSNLSIKSSGNFDIEGTSWVSADANGGGKAGSVDIDARNIIIGSGSRVSSSSPVLGAGATSGAGFLTLHAAESFSLQGDIRSENGDGTSGNISISAPEITVSGTGFISSSLLATTSSLARRSGDIIIETNKLSLVDNGRIETRVFYSNNGSSGDIRIKTGTLSMSGGGAISSSIDSSSGVGGNILIDAAESISVASIPSNQFKEKGSIASDSTAGNAGHITLNSPLVSITGGGSVTTIARGGNGRGGDITVTASDRVVVDGFYEAADSLRRSMISTDTFGTGNAGNISVSAPVVMVSGGGLVSSIAEAGSSGTGGNIGIKSGQSLTVQGVGTGNQSRISVETSGKGDAGTITIKTPLLTISDGGIISAAALEGSSGNGGFITITATDRLLVSGAAAGITGNTASSGNGARIQITSPSVEVGDGGYITAETAIVSSGKGGDVIISGSSALISGGRISSATKGTGNAGTIKLDGNNLSILNGGILSTSADGGSSGKAGDINLSIDGSMKVEGMAPNNTASQITSSTFGIGDGGSIAIAAASLEISNDGVVSTSAEAGSGGKAGSITIDASRALSVRGVSAHISSDTAGSGAGGHVSAITGEFQMIDGGSLRTRSTGAGNAGDINITANTLLMKGGALLDSSSGLAAAKTVLMTAETKSAGSAGNIKVSIMKDARISGSMVTTQSATSEGGNITFSSPAGVTIDHGELSASATSGAGNGGNVTLNGGTIILRSGKVTAQAERGKGGNLDIHTDLLVASSDSIISASSRFGAQGTVLVDAPLVDIGAALANRLGDFISIDAFLPKRCVMPGDEAASTLMIFGGEPPFVPASILPLIKP